ncbi:MAG: class I SAM-dependent rRNA methyltransferase [Mariprofundaceae bacterium]
MTGRIQLKKSEERRLKAGHLWIFSNEIAEMEVGKAGELAHVYDSRGYLAGTAYANPNSLITARMLSRKAVNELDLAWWQKRLQAALTLRESFFPTSHYRWVFAEGDFLPGLVIDRFGDDVVIQAYTAGIELQLPTIIEAVQALVSPRNIYLQNNLKSRELEGLNQYAKVAVGDGDGLITAVEGGASLHCHALSGQKSGYFYDQRPNRSWIANHVDGKRVLDLFSYVGAFAVQSLQAGASEVVSIDASESALAFAEENVKTLDASSRWQGVKADVMHVLADMQAGGEKFDVVICDPPAFVKGRKQMKSGLAGYEKLNTMASRLVSPGGILCSASCSGLVTFDEFRKVMGRSLRAGGHRAHTLYEGSAGVDHPSLPAMAETRYLKFMALHVES